MYIAGIFHTVQYFTRRLSVRKLELQILNTCSMYDKDVYKHTKFLKATKIFHPRKFPSLHVVSTTAGLLDMQHTCCINYDWFTRYGTCICHNYRCLPFPKCKPSGQLRRIETK